MSGTVTSSAPRVTRCLMRMLGMHLPLVLWGGWDLQGPALRGPMDRGTQGSFSLWSQGCCDWLGFKSSPQMQIPPAFVPASEMAGTGLLCTV